MRCNKWHGQRFLPILSRNDLQTVESIKTSTSSKARMSYPVKEMRAYFGFDRCCDLNRPGGIVNNNAGELRRRIGSIYSKRSL